MHHLKNAPAGKRLVRRGMITIAALSVILTLVVAVAAQNPIPMCVAPVVAMIGVLRYRRNMARRTAKYCRRMLADGQNKSIVGRQRVSLSETDMRCDTDGGSQRVLYGSIERIEEDSRYIYIYNSAVSAQIVPKAQVPQSDLRSFLDNLKRRIPNAAKQAAPADQPAAGEV